MITKHSAGAVIYRRHKKEREFLLVQSEKTHYWNFPKGHLEGEESMQEAASRVVYEDVGLQPEFDFSFHQAQTYLIGEDTWRQAILYPARYVEGQKIKINSPKISRFVWANYERALALLEFPEMKNILAETNSYLGVA